MENIYLARLWKLSGLSEAHVINSSALPDKLFHLQHQPIILYIWITVLEVEQSQWEFYLGLHNRFVKIIAVVEVLALQTDVAISDIVGF